MKLSKRQKTKDIKDFCRPLEGFLVTDTAIEYKQIKKALPYTISDPYGIEQCDAVRKLVAQSEAQYEAQRVLVRAAQRERAIKHLIRKPFITVAQSFELVSKEVYDQRRKPKSLISRLKDWAYKYFCDAFYK